MQKGKVMLVWALALLITIGAAVFQRMTGPTNPYAEAIGMSISEKPTMRKSKIKLPRSLETTDVNGFIIKIDNPDITGIVYHRLYPSNADFKADTLRAAGDGLLAPVPAQKPAGKIEYKIKLTDGINSYESPNLVARYKAPVPAPCLITHIILMFGAMYLAVVAGLMAIFRMPAYPRLLLVSGILLFVGGMIFGAIVQKFAFGVYWSGVPFGWDLTDNKTLLVLMVFALAIWKNRKSPSRTWTIIAVCVLLAVYSIPHSLLGSELDHQTGTLTTSQSVK